MQARGLPPLASNELLLLKARQLIGPLWPSSVATSRYRYNKQSEVSPIIATIDIHRSVS
jgi:hypothetical protein